VNDRTPDQTAADGAGPERIAPERAGGARRGAGLLLCAAAFALLRVPLLLWSAAGGDGSPDRGVRAAYRQAVEALTETQATRIANAVGLTSESEALLRRHLRAGRLVTFLPYPGPDWERILRNQFEQFKNLLYPTPRDAEFAQDAASLAKWIEPAMEGRLVVVDGTQENAELPVRGEFDLLGEQRLGPVRLRFWMLRKAVR
jgi:hypothetical protein